MAPADRSLLRGLYVILDFEALAGRSPVEALKQAAEGGARLFQYRDKASSGGEIYRRAVQLREASADLGAILIINDRCDLALAVDADGVHLGQRDLPLADARRIMGSGKIIGVSTHRPEHVREAAAGGADYIGFGPIFSTGTKPDHEPVVGVEGLRQVRALTSLPVFAIGGIALSSLDGVLAAGADGVAVIAAVWKAPDVSTAVRAFIARMPGPTPPPV